MLEDRPDPHKIEVGFEAMREIFEVLLIRAASVTAFWCLVP